MQVKDTAWLVNVQPFQDTN